VKIIDNYKQLIENLEKNYNFENISQFLIACGVHNKKSLHPESFKDLSFRSKKFKEFLNQFIKEQKIDLAKEKVLVFTHSGIIKMSSSLIVEKMNEVLFFPNDAIYPKCFDIVKIDI
jgi:hypothetical protein